MDTTLYSLARETYEETGNAERAVAKMLAHIEADQKLYRALAMDAIKIAATAAVQSVITQERRSIVSNLSPAPSTSTVRGYRLQAESAWMDYTLAGGLRLADATKGDILENVSARTKRLRTEQVEVAWLAAVASELSKNGSKVKHELKEADLARIRRKVERGSDGHSSIVNHGVHADAPPSA